MCEYCEAPNKAIHDYTSIRLDRFIRLDNNTNRLVSYLRKKDSMFSDMGIVDVNFCPMCGRELV